MPMKNPRLILHLSLLFLAMLLHGLWTGCTLSSCRKERDERIVALMDHDSEALAEKRAEIPDSKGILADANALMRLLMTQPQRIAPSPAHTNSGGHGGNARSGQTLQRHWLPSLSSNLKYKSGYRQRTAPCSPCASSSLFIYALRRIIR